MKQRICFKSEKKFADADFSTNHKGRCVLCRCFLAENKAFKAIVIRATKQYICMSIIVLKTQDDSQCRIEILREFQGCIKYALLQIQIRGENPNTPIAESVSPPEPLKYMKCIVSLCSGYFESIEKHFLQYTLCKSNVGMYSTIGEGGGS